VRHEFCCGQRKAPLDLTIIDEWARLKVLSRRNGWNLADNDLWIAATACARGCALVTCDGDQSRIAESSLEVLHLPVSR
jgi:predicted nucleic acid-binding protein